LTGNLFVIFSIFLQWGWRVLPVRGDSTLSHRWELDWANGSGFCDRLQRYCVTVSQCYSAQHLLYLPHLYSAFTRRQYSTFHISPVVP